MTAAFMAMEDVPDDCRSRYKEAFEIDPMAMIRLAAVRAKWIDQGQAHNVFMRGTSGRQLDAIYRAARRAGLKTTYYLLPPAACSVADREVHCAYPSATGRVSFRQAFEDQGMRQPRGGIRAASGPTPRRSCRWCDAAPIPAARRAPGPGTQWRGRRSVPRTGA